MEHTSKSRPSDSSTGTQRRIPDVARRLSDVPAPHIGGNQTETRSLSRPRSSNDLTSPTSDNLIVSPSCSRHRSLSNLASDALRDLVSRAGEQQPEQTTDNSHVVSLASERRTNRSQNEQTTDHQQSSEALASPLTAPLENAPGFSLSRMQLPGARPDYGSRSDTATIEASSNPLDSSHRHLPRTSLHAMMIRAGNVKNNGVDHSPSFSPGSLSNAMSFERQLPVSSRASAPSNERIVPAPPESDWPGHGRDLATSPDDASIIQREHSLRSIEKHSIQSVHTPELDDLEKNSLPAGEGSDQSSRPQSSHDVVIPMSTAENHPSDLFVAGNSRSVSDRLSSPVDIDTLVRALNISAEASSEARELALQIHAALHDIQERQKNLDEARNALLSLSTRTQSWFEWTKGSLFPKSDTIDRKIADWKTDMKIAQLDRSSWSGWADEKFTSANNFLARWLDRRMGRPFLGVGLAAVGSIYPAVIARRILWSSPVSNVICSMIGNLLFAKVGFPANAVMDNFQWAGISSGLYSLQTSIEHQNSDSTLDYAHFTSRDLGNLLADPLDNFTHSYNNFTYSELGNSITDYINQIITQEGHPILIEWSQNN